MRQLKIALLLVLGWALALLAIQNPGTVQIKFLAWKTAEVSLIGIILASMVFGLLIGLLLSARRSGDKGADELQR